MKVTCVIKDSDELKNQSLDAPKIAQLETCLISPPPPLMDIKLQNSLLR
jgi:hypothetical protein